MYDALRNCLPFLQVKKRERHLWSSVTFTTTVLKVALLHGCFLRFLNCTNGTKLISIDWFLYDNGLRRERVKGVQLT